MIFHLRLSHLELLALAQTLGERSTGTLEVQQLRWYASYEYTGPRKTVVLMCKIFFVCQRYVAIYIICIYIYIIYQMCVQCITSDTALVIRNQQEENGHKLSQFCSGDDPSSSIEVDLLLQVVYPDSRVSNGSVSCIARYVSEDS